MNANTGVKNEAQIVVIGSSNVDFIMQVSHLPALGETITEGVFTQTFGGKGANQAVASARADGHVIFVTGLGNDVYAPTILENFRRDGIETGRILCLPGMTCGSALIMFDQQGHNYITVAPGANFALTPAHVDSCEDIIRSAKMLVMQMEIPTAAICRALEIAAAFKTPVLFNYAPVRDQSVPVSPHMQILVVNENEAAALTGLPVATTAEAERAAQALRAQGPATVVLTLGAAGAFVVAADFSELVPAFAVTPVDTTAAGDVFCGTLAVALVEGKPLGEAVRFANAASALSVTRPGAQPSIPLRAAIDKRANGTG